MSAPVGVLLARLAGLLESARLEAGQESAVRTTERIKQAQDLLDVIMGA